jgi:hypothetical protein
MTFQKPEVGKPIVLTVVAITDGKDGYNNVEWKFRGQTASGEDVTTNMSEKSAIRQLQRIGLGRESAIGKTLEFAVTKQGVKKFYDINLPTGNPTLDLPAERSAPTPRAAAAPTPATPAPAAAAPPAATPAAPVCAMDAARKKGIIASEKALLKYALTAAKKMLPEYVAKLGVPLEDVSAGAFLSAAAILGAAFYQGLSAKEINS